MAKRRKKMLFTLILIGLLTSLPACYERAQNEDPGDSDAETETASSQDTDTDSSIPSDSDTDSATDEEICSTWEIEESFDVPSPQIDETTTIEDLCSATSSPLINHAAAEVQINIYSEDNSLATGQIRVHEQLRDRVIGLPNVELKSVDPNLEGGSISNVQAAGELFTFHLEFDKSSWLQPGQSIFQLTVTLDISCEAPSSESKQISSMTYIELCDDVDHPIWVSSGNTCVVCQEVCEMAACPIPVTDQSDQIPLSGSPRLEIVPVASSGRSIFLFAEHRDTKGKLSYEWRTSSGSISTPTSPGAIWQLPRDAGPHLVQLVLRDDVSAQVATLRMRHKA